MTYNRDAAVAYAAKWHDKRNPEYYDFEELGGDCTNFISQCLFAGSGEMNYDAGSGGLSAWYFASLANRSPSWTSVDFLHGFLVNNAGAGPRGREIPLHHAQVGDVIQLSFDGKIFSHSLLVTQTGFSPDKSNILVAAHTYDAYNRRLDSYVFASSRLIHIDD